MEWLLANAETIFAVIGGIFVALRAIVLLTPTPKDDQLVNRAYNSWTKLLGLAAKLLGIDTTQGVHSAKIPGPDPAKIAGLFFLVLVPTLALQPGCQIFKPINETENSRLLAAQKTFSSTVKGITLAVEDGQITDEGALDRIEILIDQINGHLKEWEMVVKDGGESPKLGDLVIDLLAELGRYQIQNL